ncbi:HD domain-containing protein [Planomicrobium sp. CPCC 101079]|uniref:HD domain-containing protein n=1 Tax=Planomicrobium sp. CPCC 101079 TaxID=2599618 RepID=UPI0011B557EC|nr:HD domain-containing protein [Planomicrobium sp. CPCC 101079]TWT14289.1 bifunctional (p)ppGpp synthetase/guanosine-3',5'-bis(diphosphate) 3'-pyrophosphohydrolase [Planomicrobium sp. CPCC 101079]
MNQLIDNAIQFAAAKHAGQTRKGTDIPYISHPFAVAMMLKEHKQRDEVVAAGLLHDTLEDTDATKQEVRELFGQEILALILSASEPDKSLPWEARKLHTIEALPARTKEELALIAADKLHNLRSIQQDVIQYGEAVWTRFNRGKRDQCWYCMSLAHALKDRKEEVPFIQAFEKEVFLLFVGVEKMTNMEIELLFKCAYLVDEIEREELKSRGIEGFAEEVVAASRAVYRNRDYQAVKPLWDFLHKKGIEFEWNAEGPFRVLAFLSELKYRLAWPDEVFFKYYLKNRKKL